MPPCVVSGAMKEIKSRLLTVEITNERLEHHAKDDASGREVLEEKVELLENSINGVVFVSDSMHGYVVKCIRGKTADRDIIRRRLEELQHEVFREVSGQESYWGE